MMVLVYHLFMVVLIQLHIIMIQLQMWIMVLVFLLLMVVLIQQHLTMIA